jgi:hypothetical protein
MDKLQESRYWASYGAYKAVEPLVDQVVRGKISANLQEEKHLRADAALFLLVNFDQMIGSISIGRPHVSGPPVKPLTSEMLEQAFDIIMDNLKGSDPDDPFGYSSHKVIKSVDTSWEKLSPIFAWA